MKHARRHEARHMWARVAAGELDDPGVREWVATRARALLEADDTPTQEDPRGKVRQAAIVTAAGLSGRKANTTGARAEIREMHRVLTEYPVVASLLAENPTATTRQGLLAFVVHRLGLPFSELDTPAGRDRVGARIREAMKEAPEDSAREISGHDR